MVQSHASSLVRKCKICNTYCNESRSGAPRKHQNRFRPELRHGPRWESSRRFPIPIVNWGGDTLSPFPTPLGAFNNNNSKNVTITDRFIYFIFLSETISALASVLRATTKKVVNFFEEKVHPVTWVDDFLTSKWHGSFTALAPDDLPHDRSDLKMTWLPWRPGAATGEKRVHPSGKIVATHMR